MSLMYGQQNMPRFTLFRSIRVAATWLRGLGRDRSARYMARNAEWISEAHGTPSVWDA